MQHEQSHDLASLIASHAELMHPFEAAYESDDLETQEALYPKLIETRQAQLDHRPATLDEVRRKAHFMANDRAFALWDDDAVDVADIIAALAPVAEMEGQPDVA